MRGAVQVLNMLCPRQPSNEADEQGMRLSPLCEGGNGGSERSVTSPWSHGCQKPSEDPWLSHGYEEFGLRGPR